jgi:translocation and assembly module TamB
MQATLQGDLSQLRATLEAEGRFEERLPVTLAASTDLAMGEDLRLTVDSLNVDIGSQRIALRRPLQLTRTATGVLEAETVLSVGEEGQVEVNVRLIPDKEFDATAEVRDIALGPWGDMFAQKDMSGTLSLAATLNEQAGKPPRARFDAGIDDFRLVHAGQLPLLNLRLAGTLSEGRATVDLLLGQPDTQLIKADAAVPFALSILNGRGEVDPKAPITAHAAVDGEISQFWSYLPLPDHATAGQIKLTADLSGSLAAPVLAGAVNLRDGRYEHLQFGTMLRNIDLDGRFNERGLEIASITANDGGKGTLTGKAEVGMDGRSGLTYSAEMTLRDMAVTRMDELKVWADIDMNITGDDHAAEISSNVTVNHGEVDLEVALPPSVPQLEIANLPRPEDDSKEDHAATDAFVADLDVKVNIPGLLFVRGKGLDSEWAGNLEITGTADSPRIVGGLFARRGRLDIIGKTFLIRDSKITFFGGQPPDPILDIAGIYNTSDLVVTASLSGPASSTELTLSSQPFLPQEEILSRVLFGTSQGNLTALQAFQLAGVVSKMSGVGGGLDVIGSLRNFLNVDVLRVEGGESGPEVEMGKYLTEGVYVGTKQGTARGSTGIEVEIELTPNIKVTSENNEIDNKTGIQFKWDY